MSGPRRIRTPSKQVLHASATGMWSNAGTIASSTWLSARGLEAPDVSRWHAEVSLAAIDAPAPIEYDEHVDTRFHIDIYSEEWGFLFCHAGLVSWIRVTDVPFVHGRDDFSLLAGAPSLANISTLLRSLESTHGIRFYREHALIRTNVPNAEPAIRRWLIEL